MPPALRTPANILIAEAASIEAIAPAAGPSTPTVSQVGSFARPVAPSPFASPSSIRHARQALSPEWIGMVKPWLEDGCINPRNGVLHRKVVDQQTRFEIVGAVQQHRRIAQQLFRIVRSEIPTTPCTSTSELIARSRARQPLPWAETPARRLLRKVFAVAG